MDEGSVYSYVVLSQWPGLSQTIHHCKKHPLVAQAARAFLQGFGKYFLRSPGESEGRSVWRSYSIDF